MPATCIKRIPARDVQLGDRFLASGIAVTGIAVSYDGRDVFVAADGAPLGQPFDANGMIVELPAGVILLDAHDRVDVLRTADAGAPVLGADPWPNH